MPRRKRTLGGADGNVVHTPASKRPLTRSATAKENIEPAEEAVSKTALVGLFYSSLCRKYTIDNSPGAKDHKDDH